MEYRNLDLELSDYRAENGAEHFRVRVLDSPQGNQRRDLADEVKLPDKLRKRLGTLERRTLSLEEMISLGIELGNCLFPPTARRFLEGSRAELDDDERLRIRLRLETYALADLPWEYALIPSLDTHAGQEKASEFLVLDPRVSLVRYEIMAQPAESLDPVGTIRLVALLANPRDPSYPELDLEAERQNIAKAMNKVPEIEVQFFEEGRLVDLEEARTTGAHIFHFAGHGEFVGEMGAKFGTQVGKGNLVLVGERGGAELFPVEKLALNLKGRDIRLAVFGACKTAQRDQLNAWTGVAPALTRAGIPAVVAMQYSIKDENAIAFSEGFYRALASGESIDAAVTDGRLAIFNRSDAKERDWGVPVLYLRTAREEGVLFPRLSPVSGAETAELRTSKLAAESEAASRSAVTTVTATATTRPPPKRFWQAPRPGWFWAAAGGVAVVLIVILALALWQWGPGSVGTPTVALVTKPAPTEAPVTKAPHTEAPVTRAPTKEAPVTKAPTIVTPDTPAPPEPTDTPTPTEPAPEVVLVPDMRGEPCESADDKLEGADLRLGGEPAWETNSEVPWPMVIRTDPPAGAQVERDSEVTVVCSLGALREVLDVAGKQVDEARRELEECGAEPCFETKLEYKDANNPVEVDSVLDTEPPPGTIVNPGTLVILYVGEPPTEVTVPQVAGMTVEEAEGQLKASFLSAGEPITGTSETVEAGRVITTTPSGGEMVAAGSEVLLVVSSGPEMVVVPYLIDEPWEDARTTLARLGLQAVKYAEPYDDVYPQGFVIRTEPEAATSVVRGSEIKLWVSRGLDPKGDHDKDGMPNGWEEDHGLDPRRDDAKEDKDRDGLSNLEEYKLGQIAFASNRAGNFDIWIVDVAGGDPVQLTNKPADKLADEFAPTWSPDGKRIAFVSNRYGNHDIYVMDADRSNRRRLTSHPADDSDPDWSPDGRQLVFASWRDPGGAIYVIDVDGEFRNPECLTCPQDRTSTMPTWSPTGDWIAFSSDRDGNWRIYRMDRNGSSLTPLTNNSARDLVPAWSPDGDGSRIVFSSDLGGSAALYLINADGTGDPTWLAQADIYGYPAWSPDGQWVAYVFDDGTGTGNDLYLVKRDGSVRVQLTDWPGDEDFPAWRPAVSP